jgi:hypothetical protein
MNQYELISNWGEQKISHNYRSLMSPCDVEFEFIGHVGHPSSYARVGFHAEPADKLELNFGVDWPLEFSVEYQTRIQNTIAEAILDALFAQSDGVIFRGFSITLTAFKWDTIGGSERAVFKATVKAIEQLRQKAQWSDVLGKYRAYVQ